MAENQESQAQSQVQLEGGTYEIIRNRLEQHASELRSRLDKLNHARKETFGSIETRLIGNERISTDNNCTPRDMVPIGANMLFGYNVQLGLRSETTLADVFADYTFSEGAFHKQSLSLIEDAQFVADFQNLYKYYKKTYFAKFMTIGPHLFMKFRVGKNPKDFKTFKWLIGDDGTLTYVDNRSDHEFKYPSQLEFEWTRTSRDMHREGRHPHISIDDRVFVETVGGDLTIKVEDNTADGSGIYAEPVENKDQTLDDAEIYYASVGHVILLKIRPYQEKESRYLVFNEKLAEVHRIDAIKDTCVLLPDDHGLIFPRGYYLLNGEFKTFDTDLEDMAFERRVASPNGEDFLYVFYNRISGLYILLSYNLIQQSVATPILCHGFSIFEDGTLVYTRTEEEPQKHHAIQIWQTSFLGPNFKMEAASDDPLFKIGNKDIVRCMAECGELLTLIHKEETYETLYLDMVKKATDVMDSYFWLAQEEAFKLHDVLGGIRESAKSAIDEFEKVVRIKKATREEVQRVGDKTEALLKQVRHAHLEEIGEFVSLLAESRILRGEIISTKERRYVDEAAVEALEQKVGEQVENLSAKCVEFLLDPEALSPYQGRVQTQKSAIDELVKVTEANEIEEQIDQTSRDLEMLIDIVSNLKIEDATQTTRIIDNVSAIYGELNQVKAALKTRRKDLAQAEGVAEFNAQMKLLGQSIINYLDVCDSPDKCETYLTKIMVQLEELESRFSEFDDFIEMLAEKREEAYNAFESKRLQLVESRNKRAASLSSAAERILKGIQNRVAGFENVNEINGYFAGDMMIEKVRSIVGQLMELDDTVKADDIQSRMKTIKEDAVRQLKDRQDLFSEGGNVIQLGRHKFSVNQQNLALTVVQREDDQYFHLTGTDFFEKITDPDFLATREVWNQETVSETREVYRAEFLAFLLLRHIESGAELDLEKASMLNEEDRLELVRKFMGPRYDEGYAKGVHDHDASLLLGALMELRQSLGLLSYDPRARACATIFWYHFCPSGPKAALTQTVGGLAKLLSLFPEHSRTKNYVAELRSLIDRFLETSGLFEAEWSEEAAQYLFRQLLMGEHFKISREAHEIYKKFTGHLRTKNFWLPYQQSVRDLEKDPAKAFNLVRDWVTAYLDQEADHLDLDPEFADEVAAILFCETHDRGDIAESGVSRDIQGLRGDHSLIQKGGYHLNYNDFIAKLTRFERETVPRFRAYQHLKKELVDKFRVELRLDEFQPRVLSSFVRNKLIDEVYLQLIGDNLAKQMGSAGEQKRTDRMGLLLLVSPPGYGKTTLMEYISNRLGLIFMKINGPAIGHDVTALDPASAQNASAREELKKLNLALEMGDNIMIYLDDIQHCNPEFLQKFISLCDGSRRIEGVYKGRTRTYDLRGKKVCVCMAGNPYTESGDKFQIPDMLANRADTYNLGDIIGETQRVFELSYIENCLTSNPVLNKLATRSQKDVYTMIQIAETDSREGTELEGSYTGEEVNEIVNVLKKIMRVRDIILQVNLEYIRSAAQEDAYRTEPPFKLQGSYRNMNKIAEKILPIMNDEELENLITTHYENEAQTLTTGAEANLLKFKTIQGTSNEGELGRWHDIQETYRKKQAMLGVDGEDQFGQVVLQLMNFNEGLGGIRDILGSGLAGLAERGAADEEPDVSLNETRLSPETIAQLRSVFAPVLETVAESGRRHATTLMGHHQKQNETTAKEGRFLLKVLRHQFNLMHHWIKPTYEAVREQDQELDALQAAVKASLGTHGQIIDYLKRLIGEASAPTPAPTASVQPTPRPKPRAEPSARTGEGPVKTKPRPRVPELPDPPKRPPSPPKQDATGKKP
ncbi:DNA repair ATPase [Sulfidibacter corallicola]|uniref:DNA repair ATPase n=1 Tax=Sulfidibacter corallicola TaxID=2818388 RepID=A0A8A4TM63_SULCO|nr:DNA repair ATPase [Sulfidibacter corallicola]QTD51079.1 DNA repair ATPase [Sulfidibacter corallicola]